jgi:hypothetical protein
MARKVTEIYDQLINEKNTQSTLIDLQPAIDNAQTLLTDLNTPSRVANWRLWLFIMSVAIWMHELLWDKFKLEILDIIDKKETGTLRWYRDQALNYQEGYALSYIGTKYTYTTVDEAAKIIKRAATIEANGQVIVKVAKLVANVITPLDVNELSAFTAYMQQVRFAGTNLAVISRLPDLLRVGTTIYYDPLVLNTNGSLIVNSSVFPAHDAINNYISNLPFDGIFLKTAYIDAIQKSVGVITVRQNNMSASYGNLPLANIDIDYKTDSGYLIIHPTYPLSTSLQYIPYV